MMNKKRREYKGKSTLGALEYRAGAHKASGRQNMAGGKRYNISNKLTEEQKEIFRKAVRQVQKKQKQNTIIINPEKPEPTGY